MNSVTHLAVGQLVRCTVGTNPQIWTQLLDEDLDEPGKLPDDSCIDLVE